RGGRDEDRRSDPAVAARREHRGGHVMKGTSRAGFALALAAATVVSISLLVSAGAQSNERAQLQSLRGSLAAAAAATTTLPTWRNVYDWPRGDGYVGWHSASSSTADYGVDAALGGQDGLWLWPRGGQHAYTPGDFAEWTYTAPGTTRLETASLTFSYR